jgi:hypothetical protein
VSQVLVRHLAALQFHHAPLIGVSEFIGWEFIATQSMSMLSEIWGFIKRIVPKDTKPLRMTGHLGPICDTKEEALDWCESKGPGKAHLWMGDDGKIRCFLMRKR